MDEQTANAVGEKMEVQRVGVRVPPFWPEDPALWFAQLEHQFLLSRVTTDETKFSFLVSNLDLPYAREVKDIITNPPAEDKYNALKSELVRRLSASKERRIKQLLADEELGDRRPSQFLRHLESLAGPAVPTDFLRSLWSSRLPQDVQAIMASQADLPLSKLADLADKVFEIVPHVPRVASMSPATSSSSAGALPSYGDLVEEVSLLRKQMAALATGNDLPGRSQYRNPSRSRSRSREYRSDHKLCFYHFMFGEKARKCQQPCSFKTENHQGGRD